MNVFKWLFKPFLEEKAEKEEKKNTGYYEMDEETKASISLFAKYIAVDYIAACLSKVPIKTIYNGKENKADLFYILNYRPNSSQNASDFFMSFGFNIFGMGKYWHLSKIHNGSLQILFKSQSRIQQKCILNLYLMGTFLQIRSITVMMLFTWGMRGTRMKTAIYC